MTGPLWALVAGAGFGVFQTFNRRAVRGMDIYVATFLQLLVSTFVLIGISLSTQDITQLWRAPLAAWLNFSLAGLLHFFIGWTFLNASQKRIGAARTGALVGTTPLFATAISFVTLGQQPGWTGMAGIALIVAGVFVTNNPLESPPGETGATAGGWQALLLGLAAPFFWAISPTFTHFGLEALRSPLLGVTIGVTASTLCYGITLGIRSLKTPIGPIGSDALTFKLLAGVLVGLSTWTRWVALDLMPIASVIAISMVSVPTVNLLTPLVVDSKVETVTVRLWAGSLLIVGGVLVLALLANK